MSIALPEASEAPAAVPPPDIADARRAAYEDGQPLLPRLSALGVRIGDSTPGYGTIPGVLLRDVTDVQREWVVGLADELSPETRERVLASLFAHALDIDSERPLVIQRQEKGKPMGSFATWCPRGCILDHTREVTQGAALEDLAHYIGEHAEMTLPIWDAEQGTVDTVVLGGQIAVYPYSQNPERTVPHVNLEVFQDEYMENLGPDELSDVIARVRAHLDVLEELRGRLVQARFAFRAPSS